MAQPILNARALKCTVVIDPAEVAQILNSQNWDAPGRYQSTPKPPYPARLAICRRR